MPTRFLVDTGAEVTVLTKATSDRLKLYPRSSTKRVLATNGTNLAIVGECTVRLTNNNRSVDATVLVTDSAKVNLLGRDEINALKLLAFVNRVIASCKFDPVNRFPKLFEGLGTMPGMFHINLKPDVEPLKLFSARPIPAGLRVKAKAELDKMLRLNVIEPVDQPTEWCSGLTIAPKPNGAIRMCVDLTALNKGVRREVHPFPRVSDMLSQLAEGRVFSKLDANSGFWQVKIDPGDRLLTTFITPWGVYCFKRMPFGICSAPEFYQKAMEKILDGLEGVLCYMDDVLVYGGDEEEHWSRLEKVLRRISQSGVTLKREKCEFGCKSVKFLGHVVSHSGISPDPEKIKAISDMSPPTCKKEARLSMGMVNYLSKFSSKFAALGAPIYSVTGQSSEWLWGPQQNKVFEDIKTELSSTPVLCAFDLNRRHRISADSSQFALGAVLLQQNEKGQWQPVEYASRKLTEAEVRYAMVEKEALAITWACEKFDYYLVGRRFEIETDHRPLVSLLGEKDLSKLPTRVQRFKLKLMRYDYSIFHTPGRNMFLADSLSRPCESAISVQEIRRCESVERYVNCLLDSLDVRGEELREALLQDAASQRCISFVKGGWPPSDVLTDPELGRLFSSRARLSVAGDFILFGSWFYIPGSLRADYLRRCHEGHQGVAKCRERARQLFWWPALYEDIDKYVKACANCVKHQRVTHQPQAELTLPDGPWLEVGADVFEFRDKLYLILADYYSKWVEVLPLSSQTTEAVEGALRRVFARLGVPERVRSDNGPCFASNRFRSFADVWGFTHVTSSPRYPQSNGLVTKDTQTIHCML